MSDLYNTKRCLTLLVCCLLISVSALAQTRPDWIHKLPKAKNNTYRYAVESAIANSENNARNQAIGRVFQTTGNRLGQPVDMAEISRAVQRGDNYDVISRTFNIPINKVCEYTERLSNGSYRVYVLCQVAEKGNIQVQWTTYNECNVTQEFKNGNALLKSAFIPGLGQIGKRHYVEGTLTLISEAALAGAGTLCYLTAQDKLDIMHSDNVSYEDFANARTDYNRLRDASYVIWGAAAGLYVFNLFRAFTMQPKYKDGISLNPVILQDEKAMMAPGVAMRVRF
ncbi:MAG: hypothetical protein IKN94_05325 [Salinivirgaceae bacterium]|nr:hypothetical protein [Salinivirgaceae bacterium]